MSHDPIPKPGSKLRARIKDPGLDPVIAMTRERHKKELQIEAQKLVVSGLTGAVLHKMLELKAVEREILELTEGVQEYQDQIDLLNDRKHDVQKNQVEKAAWCATSDKLIGPFEAKYEECKGEVKVSFDYAKSKYAISLQQLIDDFGFNPTYKVRAATAWRIRLTARSAIAHSDSLALAHIAHRGGSTSSEPPTSTTTTGMCACEAL